MLNFRDVLPTGKCGKNRYKARREPLLGRRHASFLLGSSSAFHGAVSVDIIGVMLGNWWAIYEQPIGIMSIHALFVFIKINHLKNNCRKKAVWIHALKEFSNHWLEYSTLVIRIQSCRQPILGHQEMVLMSSCLFSDWFVFFKCNVLILKKNKSELVLCTKKRIWLIVFS